MRQYPPTSVYPCGHVVFSPVINLDVNIIHSDGYNPESARVPTCPTFAKVLERNGDSRVGWGKSPP